MFRLIRFLGTGSTSQCYEIEDISTKIRYAMKKMNLTDREIAQHEANTYENLYHDNILRCVGVFEDTQFVVLVLHLCENDSLLDLLQKRGRFNEFETYFESASIKRDNPNICIISPAFCTTSDNSVDMEENEASGASRTRPRRSVKPIQRYSATFKTERQIKKELECGVTTEERNKKQVKADTSPKKSFSFPGTKRMFRLVRFLGTGSTSQCYEIEDISTKIRYAMKKMNLTDRKIAQHEANTYENLYHDNILRCVGVFEDTQFVVLVLHLCENDSLLDLLQKRGRFNEFETCYFLHQILSACEYIHSSDYVHHDFKLNNIFLTKDFRVMIGDFGISTRASETIKGLYGTPNYISPEMFNEDHTHTNKVDIWAIGIMAYAMLVGKPPFETRTPDETYQKIQQYNVQFPDYVSAEARALVLALLNSDPVKRLSAAEAKSMPFFNTELPPTLPKSCITRPVTFCEVEKIVDKRVNKKGQFEYLIKWKGFDDASNSWVPASRISNANLEEFEQNTEANQVKERRHSSEGNVHKKQRAYRTCSGWN